MLPYGLSAPVASVNVATTDGEMYIIFVEDESGKCQRVMIQIGKTGTAIRAWTEALMEVVNIAIDSGISLSVIAVKLSNIYTDRYVTGPNMNRIYSGPDGFVYAINRYLRTKHPADVIPFDMPWVNDE